MLVTVVFLGLLYCNKLFQTNGKFNKNSDMFSTIFMKQLSSMYKYSVVPI